MPCDDNGVTPMGDLDASLDWRRSDQMLGGIAIVTIS
jgi:hypothetical protein